MVTARREDFQDQAYGERLECRIFLSHFNFFLVVGIAQPSIVSVWHWNSPLSVTNVNSVSVDLPRLFIYLH